jgi:uncharacterized protein YukE
MLRGGRLLVTNPLDPDELGALAGRVEGWADDLHSRAQSLLATARATRWQSTAAEAFQRQAGDLAGALRTSALAVDEVATALRRHGRQVQITQSAIVAPVEFVADLALSWLGG